MSFTPRIFGVLESEILRGLQFTVSLEGDPDADSGWVSRESRRCRLRIGVINRSEVRVRPLQGVLAPSAGVEFRLTTFRVEELEPYQEALVASIEARLLVPAASLESVATVSLSGRAELAEFRFQQACRQVRIVDAPRNGGARRAVGQAVGAIPLSEEM